MPKLISLVATLTIFLAMTAITFAADEPVERQGTTAVALAVVLPQPLKSFPTSSDIDAMTLDHDFSVFVHKDCPPDMHVHGLRKLWGLMSWETAHNSNTY